MSGLTHSSSATSLVVLTFMSVGELIGYDGFDGSDPAVEPDRLTGNGTLAALANGDNDGDRVGRAIGGASRAAASVFSSLCFFRNR